MMKFFKMASVFKLVEVILFVTTLTFTVVSGYDGCKIRYGRRGCLDKVHTGVIVQCDGRFQEKAFPQSLPTETIYLSLSNFKLDRIKREHFKKFTLIECLHFEDSHINAIDVDAFSDLDSLHELTLVGTQLKGHHLQFLNNHQFKAKFVTVTHSPGIQKLEFNGSRHLKHLKSLDLSDNSLTHINPSLLADLYSLDSFSLSRNALAALPWEVLLDFTKLNELFLCGNQIQTIPASMKQVFSSVRKLTMKDNPLHCNCNLRWLKDFFDDVVDKVVDYDDVKCRSPKDEMVEMKGLDPNGFVCVFPKTPLIHFKELDGNEYAVNCSSEGDPSPELKISLPGSKVVIAPPSEDLSKTKTSSPFIITEPGKVTCVASNSLESVTSVKDLPNRESTSSAEVQHNSVCFIALAASFTFLFLSFTL